MKNFFYILPVAVLIFVSCKPVTPEKEDLPIFTMKILKNGEYQPLKNNETIIIDKYETPDDKIQFSFEGAIYTEEAFNLEVTTTRNDFAVQNRTTDELCIIQCETAQYDIRDDEGNFVETVYPVTKNFNAAVNKAEQQFYTHCSPTVKGEHVIEYDFHEKEKPSAKIKVKVIYRFE
jgi:hypothetical protein